ncbi:hypothetical protein ACIBP6_07065 [Nonomuraea terrae]
MKRRRRVALTVVVGLAASLVAHRPKRWQRRAGFLDWLQRTR